MGKLRRLVKETTDLQKALEAKRQRIEELERTVKSKDEDLIKLTERNAVLRAANEDLQQLKEKTK